MSTFANRTGFFPIKTNLSYPQAALPAVLQLLSLDSETLFNGDPRPDVLNLKGSRAHFSAMHGPATDALEDAPRKTFSTKMVRPTRPLTKGAKGSTEASCRI
jgi:hypothetical protein